jgi:hypothetical protein
VPEVTELGIGGQFRRFGDLAVDEVIWTNNLFIAGYRDHHVHRLLNLTIRDVIQHREDLARDPSAGVGSTPITPTQPSFVWGVPTSHARHLEDLFSGVGWVNSSVEVECWHRLRAFLDAPGRS